VEWSCPVGTHKVCGSSEDKKDPDEPDVRGEITHEGNSWNISLYSYNTLGESDASSTVSSGITESFGTQQRGLDFKTLWSDYGSDVSHTDPKTGKEIFGDYCAINLSEALIKSGVSKHPPSIFSGNSVLMDL